MATFVLVHGAWHGGWCWERVTPLLEALGHRVEAPDLPGMGRDRTPLGEITLELWAEAIAGLCTRQAEPVILLGHSRGGIVISQAAERAPDAVATLVYLTAFLAPSGRSLVTARSGDPERGPPMVVSPDGISSTVQSEAVRPTFYNTTPEDWAARAQSLLCPEPLKPLSTPLTLSDARYGRIPRIYIECLSDQAILIDAQRAMHEAMPCERVITMDTDHSPFYSSPEALAGHLAGLA